MHVSEVNIYPVKSLRGIRLEIANVEARGLEHDRRWMIVDEAGKFLTQREYPKMATIAVAVNDGHLTVKAPGREALSIPKMLETASTERVNVWSSSLKAVIYPAEVNGWFSDALKAKVQLVGMGESRRTVNYWYRVHKGDIVSFADGYPFSLAGEGSLAEVNRRLADAHADAGKATAFQPIPMNRFRPNLVVGGIGPFEEDTWKKIKIGRTVFHIVKPCARCIITTTDQETGERDDGEPLKTLASFRTKRRGGKNKVLFGQNLIADEPGGKVRIGDEVTVVEYR